MCFKILTNGNMESIKLEECLRLEGIYFENLWDREDLFLYIKSPWFLKTSTLFGFRFVPRKKICIKILHEFIVSPTKVAHISVEILWWSTYFLKLCSHQMMSTLQLLPDFFNISLLYLTMKIDTPICIANLCWQVLTIKEEFLLVKSFENLQSQCLFNMVNELSGRIKILAL